MKNQFRMGPGGMTWLLFTALALLGLIAPARAGQSQLEAALKLFALLLFGVSIYLLPALIAENRLHRQRIPIYLLNLLLGWTFIGWVAGLVWSTTTDIEKIEPWPQAPTPSTPTLHQVEPQPKPARIFRFAEGVSFERVVIVFTIGFVGFLICAGILIFLVVTDPALK